MSLEKRTLTLKQYIKAEAQNLGFSLTGITTPDKPDHFNIFEKWIIAGHHGEMAYLARPDTMAKRQDPRALMLECKSVMCLAYPYPNANNYLYKRDVNNGRLASYAWLPDYHISLPAKIDELMLRVGLSATRPFAYKAFTDSAPILERDLAQRAGLGWIGKNSCLINPEKGSFFLLAEIFTDLALEPDDPFEFDRCGGCTRCVEACPTRCIQPDRTIDSRRCISYLTIEKKGQIPMELLEQVGEWVFGCDICQMVCPWNKLRIGNDREIEKGSSELRIADLIAGLSMSESNFKTHFADSPILRAKHTGFVRNVAIVAGNKKLIAAMDVLAKLLDDENETVRSASAWSIGQIGGKDAI
jgi:epoxyqueuosine reductase